jgi:hypothetical protein
LRIWHIHVYKNKKETSFQLFPGKKELIPPTTKKSDRHHASQESDSLYSQHRKEGIDNVTAPCMK